MSHALNEGNIFSSIRSGLLRLYCLFNLLLINAQSFRKLKRIHPKYFVRFQFLHIHPC